jgi:hypothetical protein
VQWLHYGKRQQTCVRAPAGSPAAFDRGGSRLAVVVIIIIIIIIVVSTAVWRAKGARQAGNSSQSNARGTEAQ